MKITSIDIFNTKVKSPVPGWAPVCVRVNTDEGICGWGETGIPVMSGRDATMTYIREMAPFIIGMDPMDHEVIWQKLYHGCYWAYGGGPIAFGAISALDIAMWDIKGKATNLRFTSCWAARSITRSRHTPARSSLAGGLLIIRCRPPRTMPERPSGP